jgi:hypothetical protein
VLVKATSSQAAGLGIRADIPLMNFYEQYLQYLGNTNWYNINNVPSSPLLDGLAQLAREDLDLGR